MARRTAALAPGPNEAPMTAGMSASGGSRHKPQTADSRFDPVLANSVSCKRGPGSQGRDAIWSIETARVYHDEQHAARQHRRDPAPPALRSPYGKPGARDADARFGGALELGGTDFGRGLFVVALAVIASRMASVVVPVVLAWVIAMVLLPVLNALERRGLSRALTSIVLVILLIASIMVIVGVLTVPLTYWVGRASELGALL